MKSRAKELSGVRTFDPDFVAAVFENHDISPNGTLADLENTIRQRHLKVLRSDHCGAQLHDSGLTPKVFARGVTDGNVTGQCESVDERDAVECALADYLDQNQG